MQHLRIQCSERTGDAVVALLRDEPGVAHLARLRAAGLEPPGDLILADVVREAATEIVSRLRDLVLADDGAISLTSDEATISPRGDEAARRAPGSPVNALVWEQVEAVTSEEATLSATYLAFMVAAMVIAAVALLQDSPVLVVGAMVVGPEFGPIAGTAVGLVHRRYAEMRRSLTALVVGFVVGVLAVAGLMQVGKATGVVHHVAPAAERPLTAFVAHPGVFSAVVALVAGVAGMLSLTAAKSATLVGVLVSVTTVPAASNIAVAGGAAHWAEAGGSALQLALNVGCLLASGLATLWLLSRHQRRLEARAGG